MRIPWNYHNIKIHPAAETFPLITTDEFDELVEDIRVNGLQQPLTQNGDGALLSGRGRYAACQKLGIEPRYTVFRGNPWVFVIRENMATREGLTEQQRAMTGARIVVHKRPQNMVPSRVELARLLGISARAISRASVVLKRGIPEIIALVDDNLMTLTTGERVAPLEIVAQENMAAKVRRGIPANKVVPPAPAYGTRDIRAKKRKEGNSIEAPLKLATNTASFLVAMQDALKGKEIIESPVDLRDARSIAQNLTSGMLVLRQIRKIVDRRIALMVEEKDQDGDNDV
jgi:hypothetical protein